MNQAALDKVGVSKTATNTRYPLAEEVLANTHLVENQPPPLENYEAYSEAIPLREAVRREGAGWA